MTNVEIIEGVTAWAQEAICDKLALKLPDDDANDTTFPGDTVTPAAFPMFVPAKDRLAPNIAAPIPSLCVQMKEGKDALLDGKRTLKVRMSLSAWNPGIHGSEYMVPYENQEATGGWAYRKYTQPEAAEIYTRNMNGWRDVWNFADKVLQELEGTEYIAGLRLVKEGDGITYGPFAEEGAIWDYYPYWFLWIDFALECGVAHREPEIYKNFL